MQEKRIAQWQSREVADRRSAVPWRLDVQNGPWDSKRSGRAMESLGDGDFKVLEFETRVLIPWSDL